MEITPLDLRGQNELLLPSKRIEKLDLKIISHANVHLLDALDVGFH